MCDGRRRGQNSLPSPPYIHTPYGMSTTRGVFMSITPEERGSRAEAEAASDRATAEERIDRVMAERRADRATQDERHDRGLSERRAEDTAMPTLPKAEPTRENMLRWIKVNFSLGVGILSLVSGACGALISGTIRVNDAGHSISELVAAMKDQHAINIDLDRRINEEEVKHQEVRRLRDEQVAALALRMAVLETQIRYFSDRTPAPSIGARR